ncbi:MAG: MFS transporter [Candidatus Lokiarchaeota archaeon]|nr:MFS transporter [Candidatus Lokiarchaeota archaeon]
MNKIKRIDKWRFWPVFLLAFNYLANVNILGLVIPIYYDRLGIASIYIAIISSGFTITYIFSPRLLNKISQRWKRKTSIIIAMGGTLGAQLTYFISLNPLFFLIARMIEGFFIGFFWTNIQSSISDNIFHDHKKLTVLYNLAWNMGAVFGFIFGAIISLNIYDISFLFVISPVFIIFNVIISILLFREPSKVNNHMNTGESIVHQKHQNNKQILNIENIQNDEQHEFNMMDFPILYPILLIIIFCFTRGVINIIFPLKSELLDFQIYLIYLANFFLSISQCISMTLISFLSLKSLKKYNTLSIPILGALFLFMGLNSNYIIFIILLIFIGCCIGFIYGMALKLILNLNLKNNTSRYSSNFEGFIGFNFLLSTIISGFFIDIQIDIMFYLLFVLILGFGLTIFFFINKKIKFNL